MEENEMLEQTNESEKVETQTTEETEEKVEEISETEGQETTEPKKTLRELLEESPEYQTELNDMMKDRLDRQKNKIEREYTEKYGRLETVVNTGLGTSNIDEAVNKLTDFYTKKGVKIPDTPRYSERDIGILANADADDIIAVGYDEIVKEVERLAEIDVDKMTQRDKVMFTKLASERKRLEDEKSLASIGVDRKAIETKEFQEFANKLNPNLSLKDKYEMYLKFKPKPKIEKMGSMKSGKVGVKEFYTADEISRLTEEDLDDPKVWEAVRRSMTGQS